MSALKSAYSTIFMGYRFPESDVYSQSEILRAIASFSQKNIVLGTPGPDTARMESLLVGGLHMPEVFPRTATDHLIRHNLSRLGP